MDDLSVLSRTLRAPIIADDIEQGIWLSRQQGRRIDPFVVSRILDQADIRHAIVGTHAVNGYSGRPRTSVDVDVIASAPRKAIRLLAARFPKLNREETSLGFRLNDEKFEAVDVLKPAAFPLWGKLVADARALRVKRSFIHVPSLGGVLASKLLGMSSPTRSRAFRMHDAADFYRLVLVNPTIDKARLHYLAGWISRRMQNRVLQLIEDARADRRLTM